MTSKTGWEIPGCVSTEEAWVEPEKSACQSVMVIVLLCVRARHCAYILDVSGQGPKPLYQGEEPIGILNSTD